MLLQCIDLSARYGAFKALKRITVDIPEGQAVAVLGHNGSGKSTLLRCCVGAHRDIAGVVTFGGTPIRPGAVHRNVKLGIGYVPQGRNVFKDLSVERNLLIAGAMRGDSALNKAFDLFPILLERRSQIAGTMSGGEQQMIAFGMALMTQPKLLILDEPTTGLSPAASEVLLNALDRVRKAMAIAVMLVEHNIPRTLRFVDRVLIMKMGRIVLDAPAGEVGKTETLWKWF